jgi:hypothetical protein
MARHLPIFDAGTRARAKRIAGGKDLTVKYEDYHSRGRGENTSFQSKPGIPDSLDPFKKRPPFRGKQQIEGKCGLENGLVKSERGVNCQFTPLCRKTPLFLQTGKSGIL